MIFQGFSTIKFEVLRNDLRFIYPSNLNNQFVRNNFENSTVSKCGTPRMPPEGRAYEGEGRDWEWRSRDRRARRVIGRPGRDNRRRRGGGRSNSFSPLIGRGGFLSTLRRRRRSRGRRKSWRGRKSAHLIVNPLTHTRISSLHTHHSCENLNQPPDCGRDSARWKFSFTQYIKRKTDFVYCITVFHMCELYISTNSSKNNTWRSIMMYNG